ncbi:FeoA family protein [Herbaspirillum sp. RV1423]|nr:FeoA family protein [Herbaspirillum sp. RV1423]
MKSAFLSGKSLRVVAVAFPSGDPVAVRLGNTIFALRRHEAEMIGIYRHT